MTLLKSIKEQLQRMKQYHREFEQDYDQSRRRVDATRKDIERWTTPRTNPKPPGSKNR